MVKFNHEEETFEKSLGITTDRADFLTASVFYEMINHAYLIDKLFDDTDDAPRNMVTKTGILEKAFDETVNEAERIFTTWEYSKIDHLHDEKNSVFAGMTMLFQFCNSDKDEFISKYRNFKAEAMKSYKKRRDD
jgi:hypothetical protein